MIGRAKTKDCRMIPGHSSPLSRPAIFLSVFAFSSTSILECPSRVVVNFTLLKYVKSQRSYGFLITKELIFGFQMLDLKDHFSASLIESDLNNGPFQSSVRWSVYLFRSHTYGFLVGAISAEGLQAGLQ